MISSGRGIAWCEGTQVVVKNSSCPAATSNSSTCTWSPACGSRLPRRISRSGPATALITWCPWLSARCTHGRIRPYSKRTRHSCRIVTVPWSPMTCRTRSARPSLIGIASTTFTLPVGVVYVVSSTAEWPM